MANGYNQYVGMRYVPIVDGAWSATKTYEPLVVVTYNGNSYISKTFVPVGTIPTNEEYWILSANYNAQVEQYRQEVREYQSIVENFDTDISDIEDDITNINGSLGTINTALGQKAEKTLNVVESGKTAGDWYYRIYGDDNRSIEMYKETIVTLSPYTTAPTNGWYQYFTNIQLPFTMSDTSYLAVVEWNIGSTICLTSLTQKYTDHINTNGLSNVSGSYACRIAVEIKGALGPE